MCGWILARLVQKDEFTILESNYTLVDVTEFVHDQDVQRVICCSTLDSNDLIHPSGQQKHPYLPLMCQSVGNNG